jgi:hypothetical protein
MRKHLLAAAASLAFAAAILAAPVQAQYDTSKGVPKTESPKTGAAKPLTPQQQKMKDCAGKWKEEKATKHVSGRDAYRAFMKECLKG